MGVLGLGEVEVERPGADAQAAQDLGEVEQHLDVALELALALGQALALGERLHVVVRQARVAADDGLGERDVVDRAFAVDLDEARQRQPVLALDQ